MGIIGLIVLIIIAVIFHEQLAAVGWVIIATCAVFFGYHQYEKWNLSKLHENVLINVRYDIQACSEKFPVLTTIKNGNKKTLLKYSWQVGAYVSGRSTNLAIPNYSKYTSDIILTKNQSNTDCRPLPKLAESVRPETLSWNAWIFKEHLIFK